jgi:hypothetical protein
MLRQIRDPENNHGLITSNALPFYRIEVGQRRLLGHLSFERARVLCFQIRIASTPVLIGHLFLRDFRFLGKLRRRKGLPADVLLHVVAAAIGWRRQETDLGNDDL